MIGTRLDKENAPRLVPSMSGYWFIGNQTWTLLKRSSVRPDGTLDPDVEAFLHARGAFRLSPPDVFTLTVLTTTVCNLGCAYCFQNVTADPSGGSRPQRITRAVLTPATINDVVQFAHERMIQSDLPRLQLLLFGGEPLLNRAACIRLLDSCHRLELSSAGMTTNGVLLTPPTAAQLEAAGLTWVQVTLDGRRLDHNQVRVRRSGAGTFDRIVSNLARLRDTGLYCRLRVNISHHNFANLADLIPELVVAGVDPLRCSVTFAWVGDAGHGYNNDLPQSDSVGDKLVALNIAALEAGFTVTPPGMKTTCAICSEPGGRYGAVVSADGSLYSSWQSAGKREFCVGTVKDGYSNGLAPERWVTCGYEYRQQEGDGFTRLQDRVDGKVLDYMYSAGLLS